MLAYAYSSNIPMVSSTGTFVNRLVTSRDARIPFWFGTLEEINKIISGFQCVVRRDIRSQQFIQMLCKFIRRRRYL